jgi:trk system potassium uptake protein TrkH
VFTTTGHTVSDSNSWKPVIQVLVFILLFGGAMAGSATGGIKTFRIGILAKSAGSELRRLVRPRGTFVMRFGKTKVEEHVVRSVQNFFLFYVLIFALGTVLLAFATAGQAGAVDLVGSSSAVASALGNVGPALGDLGSAASFAAVPAAGRLILSLVMLIGRVEIFPVLLLFTRELWHR